MSITSILYLLAFICFVLGFLNVPRANGPCGGLAFLTLSLFVQ